MAAAAVSLSVAPPRLQRARGEARIETQLRDGATHVATLYQDGCAKVRLPHTHSSALEAVFMNTAGGLTGGDHVRWSARAAAGARLVVTTPACERVYRTLGGPACVENRLTVEAGAHLDWLPQETILYEDGDLARSLEVDLAAEASFTAVEAVLLGRLAMGETAPRARLSDQWRVRSEGRLIHAEATRLSGGSSERDGLSLLAGAGAFSTILHVAPGLERKLEALRPLLPDTGGASLVGERLVVRLIAPSGLALRRALIPIIAVLSSAGSIPRLWSL